MTKRRRSRGFGIKWLLLAAVAGTAFYFGRPYLQRAQKPGLPPNAFYEVQRGDMLISIVEDGALRALNETVVRSGLEGLNRIIHLVPEGVHVKKGELLVELDSSGLKDKLDDWELALQERLNQKLQAEANLEIQKSLAESQVKDAELKIEYAEGDLQKYREADAPLLIRTVESRSGVLGEQVRIATERLKRTQELFKSGNATRSELEADELTLKREQLGLSQYQEDLRLIKKFDQPKQIRQLEANVQQAKDELVRLKIRASNEIAQSEADLKTAQRSLALYQESLDTQRKRLANSKIYAPQDGLVVYASVSPFQNMPDSSDQRRDPGRMGRGPGGRGGGGDGSGEFRGGGRRGGGSSSLSSSSSTTSSSSAGSSVVQSIASGNQRIASAVTGAATSQGANGGGSGGGGGDVSSASSAFLAYPSMRPSSAMQKSSSVSNAMASAANSIASSANAQAAAPIAPQFSFRYGSQNNNYDMNGTPMTLNEGMMVRQRQELIRLPDVSKMIAAINIHESRVRQVRAGMTAYIRVENIPGRRFKGTVRHVALLPDAQMSWMQPDLKVFPTDILIEEEIPELKPGVSARAEVVITNLTAVLSVPIQTVARYRGENVCFVKRGKGIAPVPVTTGWFNDRFVEVKAGLKAGDKVLLAPESDEDFDASENGDTNEVAAATNETTIPSPAPSATKEP